ITRRAAASSVAPRRPAWALPASLHRLVLARHASTSVTGQTAWVEALSPWPEEFGLDRMRALLRDLGDPQRAYPSIHVVGTNGKSTAARTIAALLRAEGLRA